MKRFFSTNLGIKDTNTAPDLLIYCIGYEARSRHIAEIYRDCPITRIAIYYDDNKVLSYRQNHQLAEGSGATIVACDPAAIRREIEKAVGNIRCGGKQVRAAVDVSSMNRSVMASVILTLYDLVDVNDTIQLLYSPAKYSDPDLFLRPLATMAPAHPSLSGIIGDPNFGRCVLLGLGYEYGVSLSILDSHEPDMAFIFKPSGFDPRYETSVRDANFGFDFGERNYEVIEYSLEDISYLFNTMTTLVYSAKHNTHFTAVPFGPKIFSAVAIVCAAIHHPHLAVLRYSFGDYKTPLDVEAEAHIVGCSLLRVADRIQA
jgi:hypothetical protein